MERFHDYILRRLQQEQKPAYLITTTSTLDGIAQVVKAYGKPAVEELIIRCLERPEDMRQILERTEQPLLPFK